MTNNIEIQLNMHMQPDGMCVTPPSNKPFDDKLPFLREFQEVQGPASFRWCPKIEVATGKIVDWPVDRRIVANIYAKPSDDCAIIVDEKNLNEGEYVPQFLRPEGNTDEDYVIMYIDCNGFIGNWNTAEFNKWYSEKVK